MSASPGRAVCVATCTFVDRPTLRTCRLTLSQQASGGGPKGSFVRMLNSRTAGKVRGVIVRPDDLESVESVPLPSTKGAMTLSWQAQSACVCLRFTSMCLSLDAHILVFITCQQPLCHIAISEPCETKLLEHPFLPNSIWVSPSPRGCGSLLASG